MPTILDATDVSDLVLPEFPEATSESSSEQMLGEEIASLWFSHVNAKSAARATNEELRALRAKLGGQLSEMKKLLVRPGREGQWSGFLREHGIPRATGDRLVERYQRSLNPDSKCLSEEVSEPSDEQVRMLFASVWPRLRRTLTTQESLRHFIALLTSHCQQGEVMDCGILVPNSAPKPICPSPSDGVSTAESQSGAALVARVL